MRAAVDAREFSQALDKVSKALKKSSGIPVLREALVRFSGGRCILTGTDLDTWLMTEIPAQGDDFAFVFHRTADMVKACRHFDGELSFELTESPNPHDRRLKLCMSCGHREGELSVFPPEDYPEPHKLEPECSFTMNAAQMMERIDRIKYATCRPDQEPDTRRTSIQFSGSRVFCLDGFRAAWDADDSLIAPVPFMVPAAPLKYLKLFGAQDVSVQLEKRHINISDGALHLRFRRTEAAPFDLDSAIPKTFREEIYVYPRDFLAELAYLKEAVPAAEVPCVRFDGGRLLMCAGDCSYQTRIEIEGRSDTAIGFNLNYLADALRQFKGEPRVRMKLGFPTFPVILEAEGRNDCAMVLPVRLSGSMAA